MKKNDKLVLRECIICKKLFEPYSSRQKTCDKEKCKKEYYSRSVYKKNKYKLKMEYLKSLDLNDDIIFVIRDIEFSRNNMEKV